MRNLRVVVLLIAALLWHAAVPAVPSCGSLGGESSQWADPHARNVAAHPDHAAMGHAQERQHCQGECCGADDPEHDCAMPGCALLPMQLLTLASAVPGAAGKFSADIPFHPVAVPLAPIFPFLRPPIG